MNQKNDYQIKQDVLKKLDIFQDQIKIKEILNQEQVIQKTNMMQVHQDFLQKIKKKQEKK